MSEADGPRSTVPIRTIHEAYRSCMEARWNYIRSRKFGNPDQDAAHQRLHDAVQEYFEAMHELLVTEDEVEEYWEGSEDGHLYQDEEYVVATDDGEEVPIASLPREHWTQEVREAARTRVVYVGLSVLDGEFNRTQRVDRSYSSSLGKFETTEETPRTLPVELLFAAARLLNRAAKDLGLLVDVDAPIPVEMDPDPI